MEWGWVEFKCVGGSGHTTEIATMSIYGKNPFKVSETERSMTFRFGI